MASSGGRVFYGWWIVATGILALIIFAGAGYYCLVGLFQSALLDEFPDWTRGEVSRAATAWWLAVALAGPVVGRLIDTYGVKRIMLISAVATGLVFILLSFTSALWHLYVLYAALGIAGAGISVVAVGAVVSNWFFRRRGTAMGVAVTGIGLGGLALVPLASFLYSHVGWREAYLILGGITWAVVIPAVALLIKASPGEMGLLPDGEAVEPLPAVDPPTNAVAGAEGWTLGTASRTPTFWLIFAALFLAQMGLFGVLTHQVHFARDLELSLPLASTMLAITAGMGVPGKLTFGYLADRIPVRYAIAICFLMQVAGLLILMSTKTMSMLWAYILVFGFSMGGVVALQPLLVTTFFGLASLGAILGGVVVGVGVAAALGPTVAGQIYDALGSYHWAFVTFIVTYLVATATVLIAPRPKPRTGSQRSTS